MAKWKDITGQKFGKLTALEYVDSDEKGRAWWLCKCDCGNLHKVKGITIREGNVKSCGCLWKPIIKHGESGKKTPTYSSWANMIDRCLNKSSFGYKNWGARGILVCENWRDYRNFLKDMGVRPEGTSLDRIDNEGNYEPLNCRWATTKIQSRNRRNNAKYVYGIGEITATDLADILNIPRNRLYDARRRGVDESYYNIKRSN